MRIDRDDGDRLNFQNLSTGGDLQVRCGGQLMAQFDYERLRVFEGKSVILTSTEGEVMRAARLHVDREHKDVVMDILETNQPERYIDLGTNVSSCGWVMPFEYIASIEEVDGDPIG